MDKTSSNINIYLKDVLFPPQENSGGFVTSNDELYPEWFFKQITKRDLAPQIRLHGHTHPGFSTKPSGTDVTQFKGLMEQVDDYMVQLILSNTGFPHCMLWIRQPDGNIGLIKIKVLWQYEEKINKMLDKVVNKQKPYTAHTSRGYYNLWETYENGGFH